MGEGRETEKERERGREGERERERERWTEKGVMKREVADMQLLDLEI